VASVAEQWDHGIRPYWMVAAAIVALTASVLCCFQPETPAPKAGGNGHFAVG